MDHPAVNRLAHACARGGDVVRALSGWRRFAFAFVAGLLSALAFAPYGVFPASADRPSPCLC